MTILSTPPTTVPEVTLAAYLSGQQDGQEWALLDNLGADDVRDVAKAAIRMLHEAHGIIALSGVALDEMTPRAARFQARDAALVLMEPYLDGLATWLGVPSADGGTA